MTQWKIPAVIIVVLVVLGLGAAAYQSGAPGGFITNIRHLITGGPSMPDLASELVFPVDFPAESRDALSTTIEDLRSKLAANPSDKTLWFDLAIAYRVLGDYDGAVEIWEYVSSTDPKDAISLHNLGEDYFHRQRDYKKAEGFYLHSIEVSPNFSVNYTDLFEMYSDVYKKDTTAAADILKQGIARISALETIDMKLLLARYYAERGDKKSAAAYYLEARNGAEADTNLEIVRQIDREMKALEL